MNFCNGFVSTDQLVHDPQAESLDIHATLCVGYDARICSGNFYIHLPTADHLLRFMSPSFSDLYRARHSLVDLQKHRFKHRFQH